jgi:acetyl-CoA carboxylase biotin carboxyl carrier protein
MNIIEIKALIAMMAESGLAEMTASENGWTLRLVRDAAPPVARPQPRAAPMTVAAPVPEPAARSIDAIEAPLTGVVHFHPAAEAPPFVAVGQTVRAGDTVCLIEAMKMFIPVRAERDGVVAAVLASSGAEVSAGQLLVRFA